MELLDFFDCNCMFGQVVKPAPHCFASPDQLLAEMDYLSIRETLVFHAEAREYAPAVGNARLLDAIRAIPRLHACWVLPLHPDPDAPPAQDVVTAMLDHNVRCARVYPPYSHAYLVDEWATGGLFAALAARHVPVFLSNTELGRHPSVTPQSDPPGFSLANIIQLCETHPDLPIIIIRFHSQNLRVILPLLKRFPNLYLEMSYFNANRGIELLTQTIGADRLLFGTGMPSTNPGVGLTLVRYANISHAEKQMIAGANLRRLLREVG